jgi:hypothetical protein
VFPALIRYRDIITKPENAHRASIGEHRSPTFNFGERSGDRRIRTSEAVKQQIYSLSHLATLVYPPSQKKRAEEGTRTPDQLITNQLLYQLSYFGFFI